MTDNRITKSCRPLSTLPDNADLRSDIIFSHICHPVEGCEQSLAEIIESLARLKLPGALCEGRRA